MIFNECCLERLRQLLDGCGIEELHNTNPEVINLPETSTDMSEQASDDDVTDEPVTTRNTS